MSASAPRVVVVLPAYNAAKTLERTVREIPPGSVDALLLVDDASRDDTVSIAETLGIPTVVHPVNRGYGANQKTCYRVALEMGADIVVMLHPDYQYDPNLIPTMVERLHRGDCDAVLGSRMLDDGARRGGMPWWKRLGNRFLTNVQNRLLGTGLSEFHTGYRAFTREALAQAGFERFADGFVFDAQMLVALIYRGLRIAEIPCPARYLPEASSVDFVGSVRYGLGCIASALRYRANQLGLCPVGWLGSPAATRMPVGAAPAITALLAVAFLGSRLFVGVDWRAPIRNYDSWSYLGNGNANVVSFVGNAPRVWPIPWFYSLFSDDQMRIVAQVILGTAVWCFLALTVGSVVRRRAVANAGVLGVFALGLTSQASSWDGLLLPESVSMSLALALVAFLIRAVRRPTWSSAAALGLLAGLLALARPALAPIILAMVFAALVRVRRQRDLRGLAVVIPAMIGVIWLALLLPRVDVAYSRFETEVRGAVSAPYASDTWASVLYGRILGSPTGERWLAHRGAPPLAAGMKPPSSFEDKLGWGRFREAYGADGEWQSWFEREGGVLLAARFPIEHPVVSAQMFARDLPYLLAAPWTQQSFPEYGAGVPAPMVVSALFFRTINGVPVDVVVLALTVVLCIVVQRRRRVTRWTEIVGIGVAVCLASSVAVLVSWTLVGIELVRHTAPAPLMLRLGLVLLVIGLLDPAGDGPPVLAGASP